jgi:hypothetical protein
MVKCLINLNYIRNIIKKSSMSLIQLTNIATVLQVLY